MYSQAVSLLLMVIRRGPCHLFLSSYCFYFGRHSDWMSDQLIDLDMAHVSTKEKVQDLWPPDGFKTCGLHNDQSPLKSRTKPVGVCLCTGKHPFLPKGFDLMDASFTKSLGRAADCFPSFTLLPSSVLYFSS